METIAPYDALLGLLLDLDGVRQVPRYHPEGDALYHSLQVFGLARRESSDRGLWAAALLHDVGKAISGPDHDETGADLLDGIVNDRVVYLVRHHLDLLRAPRQAQRRHPPERLAELALLRRYDLRGRRLDVAVVSPEEALDCIFEDPTLVHCGVRRDDHDQEDQGD